MLNLSSLKKDLGVLENQLLQSLNPGNDIEKSIYALIAAGGKRVRPTFALLAARFGNYNLAELLPLAGALELMHTASLVHDDIIDAASVRRDVPTINAQAGNRVAVHAGDYLLMNSLLLIDQMENQAIKQVLTQTAIQMCLGEIRQQQFLYVAEQDLRHYLYRIQRKTALLFASSCQTGAMAADVPAHAVGLLKQFGYNLGMAFQIIDDILDLTAEDQAWGKAKYSDLKQGNFTLPVILGFKLAPNPKHLQELCLKPAQTERSLAEIRQILESCQAIQGAKDFAARYSKKATKAALALPNRPERKLLLDLLAVMTNRTF